MAPYYNDSITYPQTLIVKASTLLYPYGSPSNPYRPILKGSAAMLAFRTEQAPPDLTKCKAALGHCQLNMRQPNSPMPFSLDPIAPKP